MTSLSSGSVVGVASYSDYVDDSWSYGPVDIQGTWSCPGHSMSLSDSIVVNMYISDDGTTWSLWHQWTTYQLNAVSLNAGTWTVDYDFAATGSNVEGSSIYWTLYWGDTNTRIENFAYQCTKLTTIGATIPADKQMVAVT